MRTTANKSRGRLALLVLAGSTALSLGMGTAASADPKSGVLPLECDELGSVEIAVPGNGYATTPGLVASSTQVGIPYAITLVGTYTPYGGEPEPILDAVARRAPASGRLDHCTFHQEGDDGLGTFVLDGDVWISYTPSH
jgi:hypothetical protein